MNASEPVADRDVDACGREQSQCENDHPDVSHRVFSDVLMQRKRMTTREVR